MLSLTRSAFFSVASTRLLLNASTSAFARSSVFIDIPPRVKYVLSSSAFTVSSVKPPLNCAYFPIGTGISALASMLLDTSSCVTKPLSIIFLMACCPCSVSAISLTFTYAVDTPTLSPCACTIFPYNSGFSFAILFDDASCFNACMIALPFLFCSAITACCCCSGVNF